MKFLFAGVFLIGSVVLSFSLGSREWQLAFVGLSTIVGFLVGQVLGLSKELKSLRQVMADDWESRKASQSVVSDQVIPSENKGTTQFETEISDKTQPVESPDPDVSDYQNAINQASSSIEPQTATPSVAAASDTADMSITDKPSETFEGISDVTTEAKVSIFDKAIASVKNYFMGGNLFVRIGIIILFLGVSFLLKYVSDRGFFPIEYRLIGVVIGAMALLGLGWRLRKKNEAYALLLQGAGIGILYLDIFAAFSMYQLIPPTLAFVLLFIVSMFSAALAVLQNSKSLAVLGFSGGFLAPILASSGSNDHVALFSYYAVLNIAIVAIAWFKAWRLLNLLGFAFTFIIGTVWGVLGYNADKFATTEPFLILFFLFYVLIAVLFALRQPPKLKGYVDGTLLFGVPLAFAGLQYYLVKDFEYGLSISSFAMGAFYLFLSWFVWKKRGESLKLLSEAFLALGVIFASMAIPFALAPTQTVAAWALEGAGLLWLGTRQNRLSVRGFGVLLQIGAGMIYLSRFNPFSKSLAELKPFINGEFISTMMMAIAGIISARLLYKSFEGRKHWEKFVSPALLVWALLWLFGGFIYQIFEHYPENYAPTSLLIFTAMVVAGFVLFASRFKPEWRHAWFIPPVLILAVIFMALMQVLVTIFGGVKYHPSQYYGWIAWPVVFAAYYFALYKMETHQALPRMRSVLHSVVMILLVGLVTFEGVWWLEKVITGNSSWMAIWLVVPANVALWLIIKAKFWPFSTQQAVYTKQTAVVLSVGLALWSMIALVDKGSSDPLPWIPVFNPLDIMLVIVFITLIKWWQSTDGFSLMAQTDSSDQNEKRQAFNHRVVVIGIAALVFAWLNFTLFRVAHHWFDVPYNDYDLFNSNLLQSAVSILWALSGVLLLLYSSRKHSRLLWIVGALILGMVVIKLFVIDLSALGSLGRVISFIVVGLLLTSIGYFAPLPDKTNDDTEKQVNTDDDSSKQTTKEVEENQHA